jgi:hypothetical protein
MAAFAKSWRREEPISNGADNSEYGDDDYEDHTQKLCPSPTLWVALVRQNGGDARFEVD